MMGLWLLLALTFGGQPAEALEVRLEAEPPLPVPNLLQNPGFEEGADGEPSHWRWSTARPENFQVAWAQEGRTGKRSLYIRALSGVMSGYWSQSVPVEPGIPYLLRGWFRLGGGKILVYVHARAPDGRVLDERFYAESLRSLFLVPVFLKPQHVKGPLPDRWYPFRLRFIPPPGLRAVSVSAGMYFTAGEVWYDDFSLQRATTTLRVEVKSPGDLRRVQVVAVREEGKEEVLFDSGPLPPETRSFSRSLPDAPTDAVYLLRVSTADGRTVERRWGT